MTLVSLPIFKFLTVSSYECLAVVDENELARGGFIVGNDRTEIFLEEARNMISNLSDALTNDYEYGNSGGGPNDICVVMLVYI
jgi:hypothetical protein